MVGNPAKAARSVSEVTQPAQQYQEASSMLVPLGPTYAGPPGKGDPA